MAVSATPAEVLTRIREDAERNAIRARNGIKYLAGVGRPKVGKTPKDVIWRRDKVELWRYRSDRRRWHPPVLIVYSLISRSYVFDLYPGNSFVGRLLDADLDVFLIDWGVPDERDAGNTFETYVDYYLPQAIAAMLSEADTNELTVMGYCAGGILSLMLTARHDELPIRNLITLATPVEFSEMHLFSHLLNEDRIDPETVLDETGNVPPEVTNDLMRIIKPTDDLNRYATLLQNLWNDESMAAFQAMGQWAKDQVPFPGGTFRQAYQMMRENAFVNDTMRLRGKHVHLADIRCPLLVVLAERDHISPAPSVAPLADLVGSADVEVLRLPAGHVGMLASRTASKVTLPRIVEWIRRHSEEQVP